MQYPMAVMRATYINAHRAKGAAPVRAIDLLPFRPQTDEENIDSQLLHGDW